MKSPKTPEMKQAPAVDTQDKPTSGQVGPAPEVADKSKTPPIADNAVPFEKAKRLPVLCAVREQKAQQALPAGEHF
ncbi:MAG: hypothetical protein GXY32_03880 [Ruminococcaceae bacterium]|nr:hypothetical protein [Oscillospiraceae bacterium]